MSERIRVHGEIALFRLYDVGYEIHLDRAAELLASDTPERPRPLRGEGQAIQIANPPVSVPLGMESVEVDGVLLELEVAARIFDFGVISLRARVAAPAGIEWNEFASFGNKLAASRWAGALGQARDRLVARIAGAIERPELSPVSEDYVLYRVHRLEDDGGRLGPEVLRDEQIAKLLLEESRPLSAMARRELLSQRFSYFDDDLAVIAWNSALVVEPIAEDGDVQYVLEFANAQLLELRLYDALLDAEVPRTYDAVAAARQGFHLLGRRYSRLLAGLQTRVADATELVERVENSLKVTDDVFLARIYSAALEIFRERTWRNGIDRKVAILRDTYSMLNAESQARRSEMLELIIVLLIVLEVLMSLVGTATRHS